MKGRPLQYLEIGLLFVAFVNSFPTKSEVTKNVESTPEPCLQVSTTFNCTLLKSLEKSMCETTQTLAQDACIRYKIDDLSELPNENFTCPVKKWVPKYTSRQFNESYSVLSDNVTCNAVCKGDNFNVFCRNLSRLLLLFMEKDSVIDKESSKNSQPIEFQGYVTDNSEANSPKSLDENPSLTIQQTHEEKNKQINGANPEGSNLAGNNPEVKVPNANDQGAKSTPGSTDQFIPHANSKENPPIKKPIDDVKKQTPSTSLNDPDNENIIPEKGPALPTHFSSVPGIETDKELEDEDTNFQGDDEETRPDGDGADGIEEEVQKPEMPGMYKANKDHLISETGRHQVDTGTFVEAEDSHFFIYFITFTCLTIIGYIAFHNKNKILALALEGRRGRSSRRRPNSASYRKLDTSLEEAMMSHPSHAPTSHVIY